MYLPAESGRLEPCANEVDNIDTASGLGDDDLRPKALDFFFRWGEAVIRPPHELDGNNRAAIQESLVDGAKAAFAQDPVTPILMRAYFDAV